MLALALALSYTKILGVEKRSILAFVMVSALILTVIFTSGISLALRNKPSPSIKNEELIGYLILISILSLIVGLINCLLLLVYSHLKSPIPMPLYIVCFIYSVLACVNLGFQDALIASGSLKIATIFDLVTIIIQIFALVFFVDIAKTSLIVSVFVSFIFSYSLISFATGSIFLNGFPAHKTSIKDGIQTILVQSKNQHMFGIANGLVDRVDRFLIGLILPIAFLAKYALLSSIISFARFLPDSIVKMSLLKHHKGGSASSISYTSRGKIFVLLAAITSVGLAQAFIYFTFGSNWQLPIFVALLLVVQEILRGNYQLKATKLIAMGGRAIMSKLSGRLIVLSVLLIASATHLFGVWGAPLAMVITYLVLTFSVEKELQKYNNAC